MPSGRGNRIAQDITAGFPTEEARMLMQTLVALCAWMLADREPSPEDIAMHKTLLAEVAATGSLTFANKSDLVVVAKRIDGQLLLDATISRTNSGGGNFLVEGKRAKLAL